MTMIIAHTKTEHFLAFNVYVPLVLLRITLKGRYYYYSHIAYEATGAQGGQVTCLRSSSGEGVKSEMDPRLSGSDASPSHACCLRAWIVRRGPGGRRCRNKLQTEL